MDFPNFEFEKIGEADVREEILAPLLRHLGYRSGTEHDVIREQSLAYKKLQLGREKDGDPTVRGRADYVCTAGGSVRWTIEAKAPSEFLDERTGAQAWSYANHPEIRAVYFVLCNGWNFQVFQTNRGAQAKPIFECAYSAMSGKLTILENILAPSSLLRDHPASDVDTGLPIARGFRSSVHVTGGRVLFDRTLPPIPPLNGMLMSITAGRIERAHDGTLKAHLVAMVLREEIQAANEKYGLNDMHLTSESREVSYDFSRPTIFRSRRSVCLFAGEKMINMLDWTMVILPSDVNVDVFTEASGHLKEHEFIGRFTARFQFPNGFSQTTEGDFRIDVA